LVRFAPVFRLCPFARLADVLVLRFAVIGRSDVGVVIAIHDPRTRVLETLDVSVGFDVVKRAARGGIEYLCWQVGNERRRGERLYREPDPGILLKRRSAAAQAFTSALRRSDHGWGSK
jgi:hypothetical protein